MKNKVESLLTPAWSYALAIDRDTISLADDHSTHPALSLKRLERCLRHFLYISSSFIQPLSEKEDKSVAPVSAMMKTLSNQFLLWLTITWIQSNCELLHITPTLTSTESDTTDSWGQPNAICEGEPFLAHFGESVDMAHLDLSHTNVRGQQPLIAGCLLRPHTPALPSLYSTYPHPHLPAIIISHLRHWCGATYVVVWGIAGWWKAPPHRAGRPDAADAIGRMH